MAGRAAPMCTCAVGLMSGAESVPLPLNCHGHSATKFKTLLKANASSQTLSAQVFKINLQKLVYKNKKLFCTLQNESLLTVASGLCTHNQQALELHSPPGITRCPERPAWAKWTGSLRGPPQAHKPPSGHMDSLQLPLRPYPRLGF